MYRFRVPFVLEVLANLSLNMKRLNIREEMLPAKMEKRALETNSSARVIFLYVLAMAGFLPVFGRLDI